MAREKGQKAIKNLDIIKNRGEEISKIFEQMPIEQMGNMMRRVRTATQNVSKDLSESLNYSKENVKKAQDQSKAALLGAKYSTTQNKLIRAFRGLQIKTLRGQDKYTRGLKGAVDVYGDLKQGAKDLEKATKNVYDEVSGLLSKAEGLDAVFGGIGETIGSAVTNPLVILTTILTTFNSQQEAIADQFGAMGVTRFGSELRGANAELSKLGFSASESQKAISDIANEFGLSVGESAKLAESAGEIAVGLGMTLEESQKLLGTLTTIGGLSTKQAEDFAKQAASLAEANNVAPDEVLNDIAGDTALFAKFAKDGGGNIARAAIQARKLGVEITDITGSMEGMLDFQGSLNSEIEASVMLGRNLNLQKARELSLAGDIEGFQKEILKQVGSEAEFNKMNVLQKQALAKATGLTVDKLAKMVSKEKEAATLAGEMNKQKVEDLVSAEALTGMAQFANEIKALGIELSTTLGPALNMVVGVFAGMAKGLNSIGVLLPLIIGLTGIMTAKMLMSAAAATTETLAKLRLIATKDADGKITQKGLLTYAKEGAVRAYNTSLIAAETVARYAKIAADKIGLTTLGAMIVQGGIYASVLISQTGAMIANTASTIANTAAKVASGIASMAASLGAMVLAAANFFAGAAAGSLASFGFGAPALIAFAVAGVAAMVAGIMKAKSAGDMMSPAKGKTMVSTKEGGLFEMSKNDDLLAAPGLAGAMAGGGSTVVNNDTSAIEKQGMETNTKLDQLITVMLDSPKQIGKRVGGKFNEARNA